MDAGREHGHPLQVAGQRPDVVDAGEVHQLADLLEADLGVAVVGNTPEQFAEQVRKDQAYYVKLVRDTKLKID